MSIRSKVLFILVSALCLSFVVSALAYLHVDELDSRMGAILDQKLPAANISREIRRDINKVQAIEGRMILDGDVSHLHAMEEVLARAEKRLGRGEAFLESPAQKSHWAEMVRVCGDLRGKERGLANLINVEVRAVVGLQRRTRPRMKRLQATLQELKGRLGALEKAEGWDEVRVRRSQEAADEALSIVGLLLSLEYSTGQIDAYSHPYVVNAIKEGVDGLGFQLKVLNDAGALEPEEKQALASRELLSSLQEIEGRITDVNKRLMVITGETQQSFRLVRQLATEFEQGQWELIQITRNSITQRRTRSGYLILFFLVIGVLFVAGLAALIMRSVTSSIGRLVMVSRRLRRGDLDVRVNITGKDELQELGSSFNTMAEYLQTRRKRQNDYNEIVTILNTTIGLVEVLEASFTEVIQRTNSDLGAIYLYEREEDMLILAQTHALSKEDMENREVRIGEGIVGQVARSRRLAYVHPVPESVFGIVTGVGRSASACLLILPLVHLDVLLGVIVLGSTRTYSDEDVTFIEGVVFQLSVAVSNARFYQTIEATSGVLREANEKLVVQQRELKEANDQLAEANRLKSEFLANVTHELRTPLNSIMGYTELVADSAELTAGQQKSLATVQRNAENLFRLISDLLDISKMESSKVPVTVDVFDLCDLIREAVDLAAPLVEKKTLSVTARLPDGEIQIHSDRIKCKQILVNLLSNAIKFTETGEVIVEVEVKERVVEIHVHDSGIGIRSEDLEVIFDKFRQIDGSTSRKYGGAGLGLAITQKLCEFLKGEVSAASVPGEGSTFTVRLPLRHIEERDLAEEHGARRVVESDRRFLLVIDDDPGTVVNLREGLPGGAWEVRSAFTGRDAMDILTEFNPVSVVIGATLPEGDERQTMFEVWNLIKERSTAVVLVWDGEGELPSYGHPSGDLEKELTTAKIARVVGCVPRPVSAAEVLKHLVEAGVNVEGEVSVG